MLKQFRIVMIYSNTKPKHMLGLAQTREPQCEFENEGSRSWQYNKHPKVSRSVLVRDLGSKGEKGIVGIKGNLSISMSLSKLDLRGKSRRYGEIRLKRRKH